MKKMLVILMVIGLSLSVVAEEKEKITLKGWGGKFFEALDQEVEDTKSYQKKQWEKVKKQFKNLFNKDDKDWDEIDNEIKEKKDETKEEK